MEVNLTASMTRTAAPQALPGGSGFVASAVGDGVVFAAGPMKLTDWLWFDMLIEGKFVAVFELRLYQGDERPFKLSFSCLNECSARIRLPLTATRQNAWALAREGAWLKPTCYGAAIDPAKVDRIELRLLRFDGHPVHFAITPIQVSAKQPPKLETPILPRGPLLDELGQSLLHQWPSRSRDRQEVIDRLKQQESTAATSAWPATFSRWGGMADGPKLAPTGRFATHFDGKRWWLIDPDGHRFWSAGMDCVSPNIESTVDQLDAALTLKPPMRKNIVGRQGVNFLIENLVKAFGEQWAEPWAKITLAQLRSLGFNTVGNWSQWQIARAAGFPYVRPLNWTLKWQGVFREFPDVFDDAFAVECQTFAQQLNETKDDPAMIGYFLMNEPTWGFANQLPAEGMLINTDSCQTRLELASFLRQRHGPTCPWSDYAQIERGRWKASIPDAAKADLKDFSTVMVERLMSGLTTACKAVDPSHLNLGARYHTVPPDWALKGMGSFDVFSINCYENRVPPQKVGAVASALNRPVLIGEWHFGAHDAGLPAAGIGRVGSQADRGRAFRYYTETAAALPACVGVHYFTLYDQSAVGRFDGENYNIGFLDVCNRVYEPLAIAARGSHERLYDVATGKVPAFNDPPEFLPKLFM